MLIPHRDGKDRQRQAAADFEKYGFMDVIVSRHRDVCLGLSCCTDSLIFQSRSEADADLALAVCSMYFLLYIHIN